LETRTSLISTFGKVESCAESVATKHPVLLFLLLRNQHLPALVRHRMDYVMMVFLIAVLRDGFHGFGSDARVANKTLQILRILSEIAV